MSFPNQDDQRLTFVSVSVLLKKPTKHLLVIYQPAHRSQSAYLFHPPTQETTPFNGCLLMGACRNLYREAAKDSTSACRHGLWQWMNAERITL